MSPRGRFPAPPRFDPKPPADAATPRIIAINTGLLTLTEFFTKILSLVLIIMVARKLGPAQMGIYAFALTFVQVFEIFINFGTDRYIQREIGREPQMAGQMFSQIFSLKLLAYLLVWLAILVLGYFMLDSPLKRGVVWILSLTLFFRTNIASTTSFFRATLQAKYEALVIIALRLVYGTAGLVAIFSGYGLLTLVSLELASTAGACCVAWWLFYKHFGGHLHLVAFARVLELARAAKDFLLIRMVLVIFNSTDMLMLSWLAGDVATGYYSVAMRLSTALDFLPEAFGGAFLPVLSSKVHDGWAAFTEIFQHYYKYLLILGVGLAAGLSGLAEEGIFFVFGANFLPAVSTLRWLALALALDFVNRCFANALIALDEEKHIIKNFTVASAGKIILNYLLIPWYQNNGAALATVLAELFVLFLQLRSLGWTRLKTMGLLSVSLRPLAVGALTFGFVWGLRLWHLNLLLSMGLSGLAFLLLLVLTGAISWQELAAGRSMLRGSHDHAP
jgi:O-antigen/teichoic acid export membrane protein